MVAGVVSPAVWLHASPFRLSVGDILIPIEKSGLLSSSFGARADESAAKGYYRRDRVYLFDSEGVPVEHHLDRWAFTSRGLAYIYEVEPIGDLESDPDPSATSTWRCCETARVRRRVWPPMSGDDDPMQRVTRSPGPSRGFQFRCQQMGGGSLPVGFGQGHGALA